VPQDQATKRQRAGCWRHLATAGVVWVSRRAGIQPYLGARSMLGRHDGWSGSCGGGCGRSFYGGRPRRGRGGRTIREPAAPHQQSDGALGAPGARRAQAAGWSTTGASAWSPRVRRVWPCGRLRGRPACRPAGFGPAVHRAGQGPLCHSRNRLWLISQGRAAASRGSGLAAERRSVLVTAQNRDRCAATALAGGTHGTLTLLLGDDQ
jgi:hypothetical protein